MLSFHAKTRKQKGPQNKNTFAVAFASFAFISCSFKYNIAAYVPPVGPPDSNKLTPGKGVGCIKCSELSLILTSGQELSQAPTCGWGQDIVIVAKTPSCITKIGINRLLRFINPPRIHVITTDDKKCPYFEAMSSRIQCLNENSVWSTWNYSKLLKTFQKYYPNSEEKWRNRVGWYFQQLLKLGAADYLGDKLSEYYMVWDADMVMMAQLYPTCFDENTATIRILLELGGWTGGGYNAAYFNMFGEKMLCPPSGSFVGHRMVAQKSKMMKLLNFLKLNSSSWQEGIISHLDEANLRTGFSEYATYSSWLLKNYPDEAMIKDRVTWNRHLKWTPPDVDPCCPTEDDFEAFFERKNRTLNYVGVELGHPHLNERCKFSDSKYEVAYGLEI